jgi:hypothetical protein
MSRNNTGDALLKGGAMLVGVGFLSSIMFGNFSQWFWIVLALCAFVKIGSHASKSK